MPPASFSPCLSLSSFDLTVTPLSQHHRLSSSHLPFLCSQADELGVAAVAVSVQGAGVSVLDLETGRQSHGFGLESTQRLGLPCTWCASTRTFFSLLGKVCICTVAMANVHPTCPALLLARPCCNGRYLSVSFLLCPFLSLCSLLVALFVFSSRPSLSGFLLFLYLSLSLFLFFFISLLTFFSLSRVRYRTNLYGLPSFDLSFLPSEHHQLGPLRTDAAAATQVQGALPPGVSHQGNPA